MTANIQVTLVIQADCNLECVEADLELLNVLSRVLEELGADLVGNDGGANEILAVN